MATTLSKPGYSIALFDSIALAGADWQRAMPEDNIFLQLDFLSSMEAAPPVGMDFRYLVFYENKLPVGVALCQIQYFQADQSVNLDDVQETPCFFNAIARSLKGFVARNVGFYTMACGNLLLTGEHGYYFKAAHLAGAPGIQLLEEALLHTQQQLREVGTTIAATLIKELFESSRVEAQPLVDRRYIEFTIQPNMIMNLDPAWASFEDYKAAISSKYRVKLKKAQKCLKHIEKRELSIEDIREHQERMYDLYRGIAINSGFNVLRLNRNYMLEMKTRLPKAFKVMGYYEEGKLIAFYTSIRNGAEMEAHFLGFDKERNRDLKVYFNILLDLVEQGIQCQAHKIIFARTAMEIKSSVGAIAHEMYCYMRHRNSLSNRFIKPVLNYLRPMEPWQARNPFKAPNS